MTPATPAGPKRCASGTDTDRRGTHRVTTGKVRTTMSRRGHLPGLRSRLRAASAIAVGACLVLSACGGDSGSSDGTTTISFWDTNASPTTTPLWQHTIKEFQRQNPKIKVNYVGIPIAQVQQKYD